MANIVKASDGSEIYEHEIFTALEEYQAREGIESYEKATQNQWSAALMDVCDVVFRGTNKLKADNYDNNNLMYGGVSNNNAYDLDKINKVFRYYCKLCYAYDKEISVSGFSKLTGISKSCFYGWAGNDGYSKGLSARASQAGVDLLKNINDENEESLNGLLLSGKRPPMSVLPALNRKHGWNMGQPQGERQEGLPDRTAADIAARHRVGQIEKPTLPDGILDE